MLIAMRLMKTSGSILQDRDGDEDGEKNGAFLYRTEVYRNFEISVKYMFQKNVTRFIFVYQLANGLG